MHSRQEHSKKTLLFEKNQTAPWNLLIAIFTHHMEKRQ